MADTLKRLRRLKMHTWQRELVQEHRLSVRNLILPVFICEEDAPRAIRTLPGVSRYSVQELAGLAHKAEAAGIPALMLFPCTPTSLKNDEASEAFNSNNLICKAIRVVREAVPTIGIIADVALDPYTSHGHDGIVSEGIVNTEATIPLLVKQALIQAAAGAHILAPSDMLDGRVHAIRTALDEEGYRDVAIMSYAAKYASGFYGAFREAVGSAGALQPVDKRSYQLNPANAQEALLKIQQDVAEGADMIIVKPALSYLDIIARASDSQNIPIIAYQVSGEYAMLKYAAASGIIDYKAAQLECLLSMKRAGARAVITYGALDVANWIAETK